MAQKATKQLARRNSARLNHTHLITLAVHVFFLILRAGIFRGSFSRSALIRYVLVSIPAGVIEAVFERGSRPAYHHNGEEVRRAGEDLEAKGLTEWMWDVLYWTWACIAGAAVFGDWFWWMYVVVPCYSAWLAWTTYTGMRSGLGGLMGAGGAGGDAAADAAGTGQSKRQAKMEKRGGAGAAAGHGQKVMYR